MDKIYSRFRIRIPKMKSRKNSNRRTKKIIFPIILCAITVTTSMYILKSIDPIFDELCIAKAASIATDITNRKSSDVLAQYNYQDTIEIQKSEDGKSNMINTDVVLLNRIISDIAIEIQKELDKTENKDIEIPIGTLTGNKYLASLGPNIKIQIMSVGDIATDIKTEFKSAGINQTVYRIYMDIECNVSILTSYKTIEHKIRNQVLLVETVIVGEIPETYLNLENK